jgi:hypothetical protein
MNLKVSKRFLLFEAALVWTFAGGMLLFRGNTYLDTSAGFPYLSIEASITCGLIFFMLLFLKISRSHIRRISQLPGDSHRLYEFFSFRSYLMMVGMISLGIFLRKSSMIPLSTLALAYITMGIPLLLSSVLFYYRWGVGQGAEKHGA